MTAFYLCGVRKRRRFVVTFRWIISRFVRLRQRLPGREILVEKMYGNEPRIQPLPDKISCWH